MRTIEEATLVAYLKAKGFQEASPPKLVKNTVTFFFEDSAQLNTEIEAFFSHKTLAEPLTMAECLRLTKAQIIDIKRHVRDQKGGE